jgi:hypothetical protein
VNSAPRRAACPTLDIASDRWWHPAVAPNLEPIAQLLFAVALDTVDGEDPQQARLIVTELVDLAYGKEGPTIDALENAYIAVRDKSPKPRQAAAPLGKLDEDERYRVLELVMAVHLRCGADPEDLTEHPELAAVGEALGIDITYVEPFEASKYLPKDERQHLGYDEARADEEASRPSSERKKGGRRLPPPSSWDTSNWIEEDGDIKPAPEQAFVSDDVVYTVVHVDLPSTTEPLEALLKLEQGAPASLRIADPKGAWGLTRKPDGRFQSAECSLDDGKRFPLRFWTRLPIGSTAGERMRRRIDPSGTLLDDAPEGAGTQGTPIDPGLRELCQKDGAEAAWQALDAEARPARTYRPSESFAEGDAVGHPKFGTGFVWEIRPDGSAMDVLFRDRIRRLACARPS